MVFVRNVQKFSIASHLNCLHPSFMFCCKVQLLREPQYAIIMDGGELIGSLVYFNWLGPEFFFFVCFLVHWGSTVGFLLLQCSSGVVRHPGDLQVSVHLLCE